MRTAAFGAFMFACAACSTTEAPVISPYQQPNALMREEIDTRISQIPYQHREELLENLVWLAQTGEQTIPSLLQGLKHDDPKARSSCAWVLGRIHDRRTIPDLQQAMNDGEDGVRLEIARSLVLMGDLQQSPILIAGLDSDRKEVRFMCHEALKTATGHDFGYDHLNQNQQELRTAVLEWRQWWGDYAGDPYFAESYQTEHKLGGAQLAAPAGESKPTPVQPDAQPQPQQNDPAPQVQPEPATEPQVEQPKPIQVPAVQPQPENGAHTPQGYSSAVPTGNTAQPETPANASNPVVVPPVVVPPVVVPAPVVGKPDHGNGN